MKCLFLPNFQVRRLHDDDNTVPPPNKLVEGKPYWFFKYAPDWQIEILDNAHVIPSGLSPLNGKIEVIQGLKALLRSRDFDFILTHSYNSGFILSLMRSLTVLDSPPLFVIDIGSLNGGRQRRIEVLAIKQALKSVAGVIYHSSINEKFYERNFPLLRREFIHFGTDLQFFKPLPRNPTLDFALSIGRAHRDYPTLTKAWETVDFPLKIVGLSDSMDYRATRNVDIVPEVTILQLRELIHDAKLVVLPIADKNYSVGQMTLTQCMAMKKPIIVTNVPGVADYIVPNRNCLATDYGSAKDITLAVRDLLDNDHLSARMSAAAREDAVRFFDERDMALRIHDFIDSAMSDST